MESSFTEIAFFGSLALLIYTYAGYPLLVALWARAIPRGVRLGAFQPKVAIVVVAYNEEARIRAKIETCLAQNYPADRMRIVIASDGSTDSTNAIVASYRDRRVTLLPFPGRRGKASCLNDAAASCDEEIIVFTDARQAMNVGAVSALVENFYDTRVGAASGELVFVGDALSEFAEGVDAYWRYEKFIRQCEARVHSAPGVTGALYAIRRRCYHPIAAETILDDVAIPMQAVRDGYRVIFESRAHAYDRPSHAPADERVRKVRTLAGNYQLLAFMPWVLVPFVNPIFIQFVSHKVLRLVAPFAMLVLLITSVLLAMQSVGFALLAVGQFLGYAAPWLSSKLPSLGRRRPLRVINAFVLLNWYAVLGLRQFLGSRNSHLWQTRPASPQDSPTGSL